MTSQHVQKNLKMYFLRSRLNKIIKGDVIFIPNFNLLDFHMYNKMSPMTSIDIERAEYKKYIIRFRQLQAKGMIFIPKPKTLSGK